MSQENKDLFNEFFKKTMAIMKPVSEEFNKEKEKFAKDINNKHKKTAMPQGTIAQNDIAQNTIAQSDIAKTDIVEKKDDLHISKSDKSNTKEKLEEKETAMPQKTIARSSLAKTTMPRSTIPRSDIAKTTMPRSDIVETTMPQSDRAKTSMSQSTIAQSSIAKSDITKEKQHPHISNPDENNNKDKLKEEKTAMVQSDIAKATMSRSTIAQSDIAQGTIARSSRVSQNTIAQSDRVSQNTIAQSDRVSQSGIAQSDRVTQSDIAQSDIVQSSIALYIVSLFTNFISFNPRLNPNEKNLILCIIKDLPKSDEYGYTNISKISGYSISGVRKILNGLIEKGVIRKNNHSTKIVRNYYLSILIEEFYRKNHWLKEAFSLEDVQHTIYSFDWDKIDVSLYVSMLNNIYNINNITNKHTDENKSQKIKMDDRVFEQLKNIILFAEFKGIEITNASKKYIIDIIKAFNVENILDVVRKKELFVRNIHYVFLKNTNNPVGYFKSALNKNFAESLEQDQLKQADESFNIFSDVLINENAVYDISTNKLAKLISDFEINKKIFIDISKPKDSKEKYIKFLQDKKTQIDNMLRRFVIVE